MNLLFSRDDRRLVCTFDDGTSHGVVTASDAAVAGAELLLALDDVRETGFGECFWPEGGGEYRWMLRRSGDRVTVVALWSSGTLTGWEHVLRADEDYSAFDARVRAALV